MTITQTWIDRRPTNVRTPAVWDVEDPVERLRAMLRCGCRLWCPLPSEQDQRMTGYLDRKREAEEDRRTGRVVASGF
jgi:hypothetical protein